MAITILPGVHFCVNLIDKGKSRMLAVQLEGVVTNGSPQACNKLLYICCRKYPSIPAWKSARNTSRWHP